MCKLNKKESFALRAQGELGFTQGEFRYAQGEIINESTNKQFITFNFQFSVFNL